MRLLIFFLLFPLLLVSQSNFPDLAPLYTQDEIPVMKIIIDQDSLETLYLEENWYENHEYPATFIFETDELSDTLQQIGLRFRGNTSRDKVKKSFKISFNTFEPGRKYHGVEKLNINAEVNDPSMIRSRLNWDLYRSNGVVASRSNHVELYVNDEYYGLYQNIEHIDDEFVETYFGTNAGNLYKCSYPANLDYISNIPDDYKLAPWGTRTYELKTNLEQDDYSDLAEFIRVLNQDSDEELACGLSEYFNVYAYLKIAAIDVLTGNWDGYIYNQNNFYLYHDVLTGQFNYIPYDTDNTWGIDWLNRNWSNRDIYTWSQFGQPRPLFNRLMDIDEYRDIFSWHVLNILDEYFSNEDYLNSVENLHDFITASALNDPFRPIDFGYSQTDFLASLQVAAGGHVDYGVLEYMELRAESAYNQLENPSTATIINHVELDFEYFPDSLIATVYTEGPSASEVTFEYTLNGQEQPSLSSTSNSSMHQFIINIGEDFDELVYNVSALSQDLTRWAYCENQILKSDQSKLVLNEVMSSNNSTISDEFGEFDDWIEVYNNSDSEISSSAYYLSDNNTSSVKWSLPDVTLPAGAFPLFWADKSIEQGPFHTNFRLSAEGERIYLFHRSGNVLTICDYLEIPSLPSDFSFGRSLDGTGGWILFESPTPEASNEGVLSTDEISVQSSFSVYPNPTTGLVFWEELETFRVFDLTGQLVLEGKDKMVDLSQFSNGIYLLQVGDEQFKVLYSR